MSHYILDKAYAIDEADGVDAYRVVVQGAEAGVAQLPHGSNVGSMLGVTVHSQSRHTGHVAVRKAGIARACAAGPIRAGDPVIVADGKGRVCAVPRGIPPSGALSPEGKIRDFAVYECLGFAETPASAEGDIVEVFISLHQRIVA